MAFKAKVDGYNLRDQDTVVAQIAFYDDQVLDKAGAPIIQFVSGVPITSNTDKASLDAAIQDIGARAKKTSSLQTALASQFPIGTTFNL